jgi:hypothetical protein
MSVVEPHIPSPNGVSGKWQRVGEPVTKETGIPEGIPPPPPLMGDAIVKMDEKKPPGGGCPPLSVRVAKLVPLFLGDSFRLRPQRWLRQAISLADCVGRAECGLDEGRLTLRTLGPVGGA